MEAAIEFVVLLAPPKVYLSGIFMIYGELPFGGSYVRCLFLSETSESISSPSDP